MVVDLKRAFKSLVDDANWMDAATKAIAKDKVEKRADKFLIIFLNLFIAHIQIQFLG